MERIGLCSDDSYKGEQHELGTEMFDSGVALVNVEDGHLSGVISGSGLNSSDEGSDSEDEGSDSEDESSIQNRMKRLQDFVQQSRVYSGIIADTLLQRTKERQELNANTKSERGSARKKMKRDITEFFKRDKKNIKESIVGNASEPVKQPSLLKNCTLKDYQLEGLNWLITLYENGLNGILADEMGLGKTVQSIAFLSFIYELDVRGPFLITGPLGTIDNWIKEFERYAPDLPCLKYYNAEGQNKRRSMISKFLAKNDGGGVIITSYEVVMRDINVLLCYSWKFLIVDEGHRLKNINCRLIRELKKINTSNKLLLTGTPLQNNLSELWSLLNFILPDIFTDFEIFNKWFDFSDLNLQSTSKKWTKIINEECKKNLITNLHTILKPFLLRRLKKTVLGGILPPKREYIINCPLTNLQAKYYKMALEGKLRETVFKEAIKSFFTLNTKHIGAVSDKKILDFIEYKLQDNKSEVSGAFLQMEQLYQDHIHKELLNKRLLNIMMQLRQIVNSTLLFYFPYIHPEELNLQILLESSGKLKILEQLVPRLLDQGHKLLIFSQFFGMLNLIEDWCELKGYKVWRIDGSTDNETRESQISQFNKTDFSYSIFLLSTRAGSLGINLTAADTVILFDSDWNPQVDLQAMDRVHRIGQKAPTIIYRLYCDNTVETIMLTQAINKRKLEKIVIQMGKFNTLKKLALDENSLINSAKKQNDALITNKELVQELSHLLFSEESTLGFDNPGALTEDELLIMTDRSKEAYNFTEKEYEHIRLFETTLNINE